MSKRRARIFPAPAELRLRHGASEIVRIQVLEELTEIIDIALGRPDCLAPSCLLDRMQQMTDIGPVKIATVTHDGGMVGNAAE